MFVEYLNDSFRVDGGRDDKLINLLADKLNFRYLHFVIWLANSENNCCRKIVYEGCSPT